MAETIEEEPATAMESGRRRAFSCSVPTATLRHLQEEQEEEQEDGGGRRTSVDDGDHSYCRGAETDGQQRQLWRKLWSLRAKVLLLDHREATTVARIHALEREIACLMRANVAFKQKQKSLEGYICSVML